MAMQNYCSQQNYSGCVSGGYSNVYKENKMTQPTDINEYKTIKKDIRTTWSLFIEEGHWIGIVGFIVLLFLGALLTVAAVPMSVLEIEPQMTVKDVWGSRGMVYFVGVLFISPLPYLSISAFTSDWNSYSSYDKKEDEKFNELMRKSTLHLQKEKDLIVEISEAPGPEIVDGVIVQDFFEFLRDKGVEVKWGSSCSEAYFDKETLMESLGVKSAVYVNFERFVYCEFPNNSLRSGVEVGYKVLYINDNGFPSHLALERTDLLGNKHKVTLSSSESTALMGSVLTAIKPHIVDKDGNIMSKFKINY